MDVALTAGRALAGVAAALALLVVVAGCDVKTDVVLRPEIGGAATDPRVEALEAQLAEQREIAQGLQLQVERLREESIVLATDDGLTFRLNTSAALVLVFAILGIVTVLVARLKFAADARRHGGADDLSEV